MDPTLNGGAGSSSKKEEGRHPEIPVLLPISEHELPFDVQQQPRERPASLSPRLQRRGSPTEPYSDEEDDDIDEGVIGTTPPKAQRLGKTRKKGSKLKRTPSPYDYNKEKQRGFIKKRPVSADLAHLDSPFVLNPSNQPRRHTVSDVSSSKKTYGFTSYASFDSGKTSTKTDKESGKKRKEKQRKQDRTDKLSSNQKEPPSLPILSEPTPLIGSIPIPSVSEPLPDPNPNSAQTPRRHPLVTSLTSHTLSHTLALISEEGHPRVTRSHSDAQFSLTLSNTQSTRCPPDRNKFYKNFRKTLGLLYKRQQQGPVIGHIHTAGFHVPRQHSENLTIDNPFAHQIEQIWRELRAWESSRTLEEQEDWDFEHHREVEVLLNKVINYRFDQHSNHEMNKDFFSGTERERDEYEPLMSLRGTTYPRGGGDYDNNTNQGENTTPLASLGAGVTEGSRGDHHPSIDCEDDDEEGPRTLTQQKSDSDESSISSKSSNDYAYERFLMPEQIASLTEVDQLLEELENVESLYSNSRKIGDENPKYRQSCFRRKRDALILWSKVSRGLADHLARLSKWFGVPIISQPSSVHTPITPSRTNSDGMSSHPLGVSIPDLSTIDPELSLGGLSRLSSGIFLSQVSQLSQVSTSSKCSLGRMSAPRTVSNIDSYPSLSKGYRKFVDRMLKKKDIEWLIDELKDFIKNIFVISDEAIKVRNEELEDDINEEEPGVDPIKESWPLLTPYLKTNNSPKISRRISSSPRCWLDEFDEMNLPSFFQLVRQNSTLYKYIHINIHTCISMIG